MPSLTSTDGRLGCCHGVSALYIPEVVKRVANGEFRCLRGFLASKPPWLRKAHIVGTRGLCFISNNKFFIFFFRIAHLAQPYFTPNAKGHLSDQVIDLHIPEAHRPPFPPPQMHEEVAKEGRNLSTRIEPIGFRTRIFH